ncbi:MAG: hypothetical protein MUO64_02315 [Anaerolineales bacterium]|nr:hypothetical protein [Anaerolineales bacterium]
MMRKLPILAGLLLAVLTGLAACTTASSGPTTWLDQPLDGAKLPLARLVIMAHASDDDGLRRFEFFIDQQSLVSVIASGGRFGEANVEWQPPAPGTYTVHVRAVDNQGNAGPDAISVVTIGEIVSQPTIATPTPTPAVQLQLSASPTPSPIALATTLTPMTPSPSPTTPAVTEVVARQNANCRLGPGTAYETTGFLLQGQRALVLGRNTQSDWFLISLPDKAEKCWVSKSTVEFQGNINLLAVISAPPPPQIITVTVPLPPPQIITVTVGAIIIVPPPLLVDITPPVVSFPSALPPQILVDGPGCLSYPRITVVSVTVTDESGVSNVAARWSIGGQAGEVSMSSSGAGVYQAVIGPLNTVGELAITIFAVDLAGNSAESGPAIVQIQNCIE